MRKFKVDDEVRLKAGVNMESASTFRMESNIRAFLRDKNDQSSDLRVLTVDSDGTIFVQVIGRSGIHQYWLDAKCVELIVEEPVGVDIGNSVERLQVVNYKFEGQVYNDKKQLLGVLLNKVQKITANNFSEVMKKLKEVEETWNKM